MYHGQPLNLNEAIMTLDSAIIFATECHKGQTRKYSGLPYIIHPLAVMNTLIDCGFSYHKDLLVAAVLHDVVEDCGITITEIGNKFGHVAASFVQDVTKSDKTYYGKTSEDKWRNYLSYLSLKSPLSKALKIADRYCNITDFYRDWYKLEDTTRNFVENVYIKEAKDLIEICENEEKSIPLCNVIYKLSSIMW